MHMMLGAIHFLGFALAAPFTIVDRTSDLPAGNVILTALNENASTLEAIVNNGYLSSASRSTFNEAVAKSASSSGNALWMDRGSSPDRFSVGLGAQVQLNMSALNLSALNFSTNNSLPPIGGGASVALNVGVPGTLFVKKKKKGSDRWFVYLSGMYASVKIQNSSFTMGSFGANAQYRLVSPRSLPFIGWGGVTLASGLNYSTLSLAMTSNLQMSSNSDVGGKTVTVNINMDYDLGIRSSVITIPLEVSTYGSILYLFTMYLGAACDLNYGSASLTGSATGPVTATYSGGFSGNLFSATGSLNLDDGVVSRPTAAVGRFFGGLQFNVWVLKLVAHYNYLTNGTHGVGLVARASL